MSINPPDSQEDELRDGQSPDHSESQQPLAVKAIGHVLQELGLVSLFRSSFDVKLLVFQRFVRVFGYGASTLVLVAYLSCLNISDERIGLFMTLTLFGDVLISFALTLVTDSIGRRWILALGATLMALSGVIFAFSSNYWVLLIAAVIGIISPGGNEIGPFRAIEESTIAHLTLPAVRADIFAWYSLSGPLGAACGLMACGWLMYGLKARWGWETVDAYRAAFVVYGCIGILKLILSLSLSSKCEADRLPSGLPSEPTETRPLLRDEDVDESPAPAAAPKKQRKPLIPHISKESRNVFIIFAILQSVDSFASGITSLSWITNFFYRKFHLEEGYLGSLFFATSILAAFSILASASLARRFGNIQTMVFTHLPSSIAIAFLGFPSSVGPAIALLLFRAATHQMDVAPRGAFIAGIFLPNERTAIIGAINVVKTASQSIGPTVTGALVGRNLFWVVFLLTGSLKACYDIGLLVIFRKRQTREHIEARHDEEPAS